MTPGSAWDSNGSDSVSEEEAAADRLSYLRSRLLGSQRLAEIPPPDPVVDGWLYSASLCWLFGDRGHGKSFVALDMAGCVGTGLHWNGYATKHQPVLYAALEGASGMHQRVLAWEERYGVAMEGVHFLVPRSLHLVSDAGALAALAREIGAGMVIIDTQNRATVGLEENSSIDMGRMIQAMDLVQQATGACVVNVHHTASGSHRPRGHTSIDGAATSMIRVARDGLLVKIGNEKQKDGPSRPALLLTLTKMAGSVVLVPEQGMAADTDSEKMIRSALGNLEALNGSASHTEIKRACIAQGMKESTFNWALRRQVNRGGVTKSAGKYALVHPGQGALLDVPREQGTTMVRPGPLAPSPESWPEGSAGAEQNQHEVQP